MTRTGSTRDRPARSGSRTVEQRFPGASESANAAVRALVQAHDDTLRFAEEVLRRHGLSATARQALATLDGAGGSLSQSQIAERLLTTPPSITSLVDTLERRGLVVRQRDVRDRRRQLVTITPAGTAAVRKFVPEAVALQTAVMAGLSEQERIELGRLLGVISATVATSDPLAVVAAARGPRRFRSPVLGDVAGRAPRTK